MVRWGWAMTETLVWWKGVKCYIKESASAKIHWSVKTSMGIRV